VPSVDLSAQWVGCEQAEQEYHTCELPQPLHLSPFTWDIEAGLIQDRPAADYTPGGALEETDTSQAYQEVSA
jgi:hypothetical protein